MIHLSGHIDVPPERLDAIHAALPRHIALSRAEPGCVSFSVTPCPTVPGRFLVQESFESRADFDAHQTRSKASQWAEISAGLPRDYTIHQTTHGSNQ